MIAKLLVVVAIANLAFAVDPEKPKSLFRTGTASFNVTLREPYKNLVQNYRLNAEKQVARVDWSENGLTGVFVLDYVAQKGYNIIGTNSSIVCFKMVPGPSIFTQDFFSRATFAGVKAIDGKIVNAWVGTNISPNDIITYMDTFTGAIFKAISKDSIASVDYSDFKTPDQSFFTVPKEIEVNCREPSTEPPSNRKRSLFMQWA
jgi:hypothetical protein